MERGLIEIVDLLCQGYGNSPRGCESCPLWNEEEYEEYEKRGEEWKCDLYKLTT